MIDLGGLRVCYLAGALGQGGAERQLYYALSALRCAGACVDVLSLTCGEFWQREIEGLGIPVIWVGRRESRLARLGCIARELRKRRPDVIQSQHFHTNLYAAVAGRAIGCREIGALRNDTLSEVAANGWPLGMLSLRGPRRLAANSHQGIRNAMMLGVPERRLYYLPNVVDTERFTPRAGADVGLFRVLAVGRLVAQKRFDRLLRVFAELRRRVGDSAVCTIVGAGPERENLQHLAAELGLGPPSITFRGPMPDLAPVYRESDVLALTSDFEGTPNVVMEAMAAGLPVVASAVGGVPDLIADGQSGFLCAPNDESNVIDKLELLAGHAARRQRMGCMGRNNVTMNYSRERLPELLRDLYSEALA